MGGLDDDDPNLIGAAADALAALEHPAALAPLAALTEHPEFWVRAAAVVALGRLRDPAALPALSRAAAAPGLEGVVVEAVRAIGDPAGLDVLAVVRPSLPLPALEAAGSILSARSEVAPPAWVQEGARANVATLLDSMAEHDDPAVGRLLGLAATPAAVDALLELAGPPRRSEAAINGLLALSPEAAPVIERWFRSTDLDQRRTAVGAARAVARSVDVAAIRTLAEDADPWIRLSAARLLGEHGESGRAALERLASEDTDPDVRTEARRQLARPEP